MTPEVLAEKTAAVASLGTGIDILSDSLIIDDKA